MTDTPRRPPQRRINIVVDADLDRQIAAAAAKGERTKAGEAKFRLRRSFASDHNDEANAA